MSKKRGSKSQKEEEEHVTTLETGHVIFFYRIKVDTQGEASDFKDVQRLFLLLLPNDAHSVKRLILVPGKHLPNSHKPVWGFIEDASTDIHKIDSDLAEYHYSTVTKGERVVKGARICGEGIYSLILHQKPKAVKRAKGRPRKGKEPEHSTPGVDSHVHFAFVLELPEQPGHVQHDFHIEKEGNFLVTVKNPKAENPPNVGLSKTARAEFPSELQERFGDKKFAPLNPPDFLNFKGAEILLINSGKHILEDLGIEGEKLVQEAIHEELEGIHGCEVSREQIFRELKMSKSEQKEHPTQALTTGEFK